MLLPANLAVIRVLDFVTVQGRDEQRTESYLVYGEGVAEYLTK
jgi:hypothetical protein